MSDEIRINRTPSVQPRPEQPEPEAQAPKSSKVPWIVLAVVVVVLVALGVLFRGKLFAGKNAAPTAGKEQLSGYEAVFLSNGQVYFGKISDTEKDYVTLKDIYYLQVGPQQGSGTSATGTAQQSVSLVKLGQELHGPADEMYISRPQILFYEDLKTDSKVVQAIKSYQANPNGAAQTPAPAPTPVQ
jgi:hypothetical protein